jgi:hypothetical protein
MFDFFKKKKPEVPALHYDPTNIRVVDIRKGFMLDYDFKTWQVEDEYEYDWGNNRFSYEFKLTSSSENVYLRIEQNQQTLCYIMQKLRFSKLGEYVETQIQQNEKPPREISYEGVRYIKERETPGFFRNTTDAEDEGAEMLSWEYINDDETRVLIIDQWDVAEFEALIGVIVKESAISNILPV